MSLEQRPSPERTYSSADILSPAEYVQHPFARSEDRSYVLELSDGKKSLTYFGSKHIFDPADPLFDSIRESFEKANPDMVYVEGIRAANEPDGKFTDWLRTISLEDAKRQGENLYTAKLAAMRGTPIESPEPTFESELRFLMEKHFPKDALFDLYAYTAISQYLESAWQQGKPVGARDCRMAIDPMIRRFRAASGWSDRELDALSADVLNGIDLNDRNGIKHRVDPMPWPDAPRYPTKDVAAASTLFRDQYALIRLAEGLKKHDRLFAVYGSGHAVSLEPALRKLMRSPQPAGV